MLALVGQAGFGSYSYFAALTIMAIGAYGFFFARKHYERSQLHTQRIREVRKELDWELNLEARPSECAPPRSIRAMRSDADRRHYEEFPKRRRKESKRHARSWVARARLHLFWEGLHAVLFCVGVVLGVLSLWYGEDETNNKPLEVKIIQGGGANWPEAIR